MRNYFKNQLKLSRNNFSAPLKLCRKQKREHHCSLNSFSRISNRFFSFSRHTSALQDIALRSNLLITVQMLLRHIGHSSAISVQLRYGLRAIIRTILPSLHVSLLLLNNSSLFMPKSSNTTASASLYKAFLILMLIKVLGLRFWSILKNHSSQTLQPLRKPYSHQYSTAHDGISSGRHLGLLPTCQPLLHFDHT